MVRPPYPAVVRLCTIAAERWGEIASAYYMTNLLREPLWKFAAMVYTWCLERVPHDKITEWEAELVELLPWQDTTSEAAIELESESFFAMANRQ